ncbi:FAD/NAD-P-binding domain-containing protein [Lentinus tigrinus ALCF2SS1-7]|uniref:FAD/NAD-P-binding domain-containing protein n=1 Tax=Lentinus tigrinus ALCF2SS1-6 TaxID=1328759 RepID=A0A5C2SUG0_9APHY|nr:FAD/NAD-P-binding domain-containing protein [Lentinus tigrinus ALCF2SS1-6]RPD81221.1 FAD/NAD-P-binding domain-containing protein [Lentinus tigrinus ALCF2SS1-7]
MTTDAHTIATAWLSSCSSSLRDGDINAFTSIFLTAGWLRELLVFSWDIRSLEGRQKISTYLSGTLPAAEVTDIRLVTDVPELVPRTFAIPHTRATGVELTFTFECRNGRGRGNARLLRDIDGAYRAITVMTELADLYGHEEARVPRSEPSCAFTGSGHPYVLIVGAAQTGLQLAARFKRMQVSALVIERNARIGDVWRRRYPSLTLHTIKRHHSFLYEPYPANWPEFTPGDKLADWLKHYASMQELDVWTSTTIRGQPLYQRESGVWEVTVVRDDTEVKLRPTHLVLATGPLGRPQIPAIPKMEAFPGRILHTEQYSGGSCSSYIGKRIVVVGAGGSSIDVCEDLVLHGARSVTMIQRSPTSVLSRDYVSNMLRAGFPESVPLEIADFKWSSFPPGLLRKLMVTDQQAALDAQKELHQKLQKGGFKLDIGPEGHWLHLLVKLTRNGGYCIDKGGADMIADGRIAVKSGVSLQCFTKRGLMLDDGTHVQADVVIFATGYVIMKESNRELLGDDVVSQIDEVYGLDEEGELDGSYRSCGHPGLWFATGEFFVSRFMSKPLALQLKAIQLGLLRHDGRRPVMSSTC